MCNKQTAKLTNKKCVINQHIRLFQNDLTVEISLKDTKMESKILKPNKKMMFLNLNKPNLKVGSVIK